MIWAILVKPLLYGVAVYGALTVVILLYAAASWWRLGPVRDLFPLGHVLRRAWVNDWPLAASLGLLVWSWVLVFAIVRLAGAAW